jgi:hypothetical protein
MKIRFTLCAGVLVLLSVSGCYGQTPTGARTHHRLWFLQVAGK